MKPDWKLFHLSIWVLTGKGINEKETLPSDLPIWWAVRFWPQSHIFCETTIGHRYGTDGFLGRKRSQGRWDNLSQSLDPDVWMVRMKTIPKQLWNTTGVEKRKRYSHFRKQQEEWFRTWYGVFTTEKCKYFCDRRYFVIDKSLLMGEPAKKSPFVKGDLNGITWIMTNSDSWYSCASGRGILRWKLNNYTHGV